jgi:tetratricopeptide (TPR) repeat protein
LGNLYIANKETDKALEIYERALVINPNLMDVFVNMIRVYTAKKEYRAALNRCETHLERIGNASPVVVSTIEELKGTLYMALGNVDAAKQAFKLSIQNNPRHIQPYLSLAKVFSSEKNDEKILEIYKNLLAQQPDQAGPHYYLAVFYEKRGEDQLAQVHYRKALDLNPEHILALNNLAFFFAERDLELDKALGLARKAKELGGENPAIMDTLGYIYYKKGIYESAIEEFFSCIEKEPLNPVFNYHLGLALNKKWDYANAKKYLKKALDLKKDFKGAEDAMKILEQI